MAYCVWLADVEVCNGGFYQLFSNYSGMIVPEAVDGFNLLGWPEMASCVVSAVHFGFGDGELASYPRDRDQRWDRMNDKGKESDDWDRLADKYFGTRNNTSPYNSRVEGQVEARVATYVRNHPEEFFGH